MSHVGNIDQIHDKKNNVLNFPSALSETEREVEAIIFAASEPLDIETIETRISKKKYVTMIKSRYMSCLFNLSKKEIDKGIDEINFNFKNQLNFTDTLKCLSFRK